jgi:hypothetical protein
MIYQFGLDSKIKGRYTKDRILGREGYIMPGKKTSKNSRSQVFLAIFVIVGILIVLVLVFIASSYLERVKMNPDGTIGNTAGNINNGGYFCEYNGKVYFSNTYNGGALYSMNPNETELTQLNNSQVRNILAGGSYLYFFQLGASGDTGFGTVRVPRTFNRSDLDGKNIKSITRDTVVTGQLVNNYLYFLVTDDNGPSFYKIKIDKSDKEQLADYIVNPACASGNYIYYNGTENDHFLYSLNTLNDSSGEVFEGNIWYPVIDGNYIYYLDVGNGYKICRYSMYDSTFEVLSNDRTDMYNVGNGYIYYQTAGSNPQLKYMLTDGSNNTVLADGVYNNINMTSMYVYYQEYGDESTWYHTGYGATYWESFNAAAAAVK